VLSSESASEVVSSEASSVVSPVVVISSADVSSAAEAVSVSELLLPELPLFPQETVGIARAAAVRANNIFLILMYPILSVVLLL